MNKLKDWKPQDWAAVVTATVLVLGLITGSAVWMTGMYLETKGLRAETKGLREDFSQFRDANAGIVNDHDKRINYLEIRLAKLEG